MKKDKKTAFGLALLCLLCLLFSLSPTAVPSAPYAPVEADDTTAYDETEGGSFEEIDREIGTLIENVPSDVARYLPDKIFEGNANGLSSAVSEMTSFEYIISALSDLFTVNLMSAVRLFARLLGMLVLCAMLGAIKNLFPSASAGLCRALSLCASGAILAVVIVGQYEKLETVSLYLKEVNTFTNGILVLMGMLYAMGGNVAAAVVSNGGMSLFLNVSENILNSSLMPVVGICVAFSAVSAIFPSPSSRLAPLGNLVKKCYTFLLTFIMTTLCAVLAAQNALASKADGLSAKTAKFIVGSVIPVVGGSVGDSLRTVGGSIELIRANVGIFGISVILIILLPPLLSLLLTRLAYMAGSAVAEVLGCDTESRLLTEIGGIYGYMIAVCASCAVLFIFALSLFMNCAAAV